MVKKKPLLVLLMIYDRATFCSLKWRSRTSKKGGVMLLLLLSALVLLSGCAEKVRTENLYENEEIIECTNLKNMLYRLIGRGHHLSDLPSTFQVCEEAYKAGTLDEEIEVIKRKVEYFSAANFSERLPNDYCVSDSDCVIIEFPYSVGKQSSCLNKHLYDGDGVNGRCRCFYSQCKRVDNSEIIVTTDKHFYNPGERVLLYISNVANEAITIGARTSCINNTRAADSEKAVIFLEECTNCSITSAFALPSDQTMEVVWTRMIEVEGTCQEVNVDEGNYNIIIYYFDPRTQDWKTAASSEIWLAG